MSNFKDRLWRDLIREHGATLNEGAQPAEGAPRIRPRLLFGGGLAGVAGVATAVAIALGTAGTSPAFAVTQNHDGSYTVELWRASGITGLNARLAQLRVPARAVAVHCYIGSGPPPSPEREGMQTQTQTLSQARIQVQQIPKGKWLELPATTSGGKGAAAANFVAQGASCDANVPPPCPPGRETVAAGPNGTSTTTSGTTTTGTGTSTTGTGTSTTGTGTSATGTGTSATGTGTSTTGRPTTGTTGRPTTGTTTTVTASAGSGIPGAGRTQVPITGAGQEAGVTTRVMSLGGKGRAVPAGVLVQAPICGNVQGSAGPPRGWTTGTGTSTTQTGTSTAAAPTTQAGS